MTDYIRCDCDNEFPVFDAVPYVRYMSCIKCRKVWQIKFSGRRLVEVNDFDVDTYKDIRRLV